MLEPRERAKLPFLCQTGGVVDQNANPNLLPPDPGCSAVELEGIKHAPCVVTVTCVQRYRRMGDE